MNSQRRDPVRDIVSLRDAVNTLFEESFVRPRSSLAAMASGMQIDLRETEHAYIVETVVAGASPEDVDISVLGDVLRIAVEVRESNHGENERWLLRERHYGRCERSVTLPVAVQADAATADFKDGILTIVLPKSEAAKVRSIPVRRAGQVAEEAIEVTGETVSDAPVG